jgi:hypothetical protein
MELREHGPPSQQVGGAKNGEAAWKVPEKCSVFPLALPLLFFVCGMRYEPQVLTHTR